MMGGKQTAEEWHGEALPDEAQATPEAPQGSAADPSDPWSRIRDVGDDAPAIEDEPRLPVRTGFGDVLPAYLLIAVSVAWMGAIGWKLFGPEPGLSAGFVQAVSMMALVSGPMALLAIAFLLVGPTSRREARRYGRTVRAIRAESARLDEIMSVLTRRIESNSRALAAQITLLDGKGRETSEQISTINESMRENISTLARHSLLLGAAATSAREEMKTLLTDLPDVERRMADLTGQLRSSGQVAESRAAGLETQISSLRLSANEAHETANGAVERLAGQLERISTATHQAQQSLDQAADHMGQSVDQIIERAGQAINDSRRGIDVQGSALIAMIEQSRAAFDRAGLESTQALGNRFEELGIQADKLAQQLAQQELSAGTVFTTLQKGLVDAEQRFAALNDTATEKTADLAEAVLALADHAERVTATLGGTSGAADDLLHRAETLRQAIEGCTRDVNATLPLALAQLEEQLTHSQEALRTTLPDAHKLEQAAQSIATQIGDAGEALTRHNTALAMLGQSSSKQLDHIRDEADQLSELVTGLDSTISAMGTGSAAQLVEVLHRVRQAATEATERARATLGSVIPEAANALAAASADAMQRAISEPVREQLDLLSSTAQQAAKAAQGASEKLLRQMLAIAETSNAIEARIAEAQAEAERTNDDGFARRVSLLIESLNSAAIDVTKILSNEVTDSAWASYLRGDRGVFTRRAVRLLDASEARDIARHYEDEPEFREQVNRYIHDFEAMLRRVLSTRDGNPLSVTLLSSDMGKLYVALAQAIERLRA